MSSFFCEKLFLFSSLLFLLSYFSTFPSLPFPSPPFPSPPFSSPPPSLTFNLTGRAFTLLEENKASLHIEDYSIAQPTLEQVFIRTVNDHTPPSAKDSKDQTRGRLNTEGSEGVCTNPEGGGLSRTLERLSLANDDKDGVAGGEEAVPAAGPGTKNYCGCTDSCVKWMIIVAGVLAVVFLITLIVLILNGLNGVSSFFSTLFWIALITMIVGCVLYNVKACKPPQDDDE